MDVFLVEQGSPFCLEKGLPQSKVSQNKAAEVQRSSHSPIIMPSSEPLDPKCIVKISQLKPQKLK